MFTTKGAMVPLQYKHWPNARIQAPLGYMDPVGPVRDVAINDVVLERSVEKRR